MKLNIDQGLSAEYDRATMAGILRDIQQAVNALAEGRQSGSYAATTAVPTTGSYAIGDFVKKSNPVEAGAAASKYVIFGWVCTASGTPGTFKECRFLTGN